MAWTTTLAEFLTEVRERGGYRRSMALTDAILTKMINKGIAAVHELIVKHNPDFLIKQASPDLVTSPGSAPVALPGDFYKLRGRPLLVTGGRILKIHPFDIDEEGDFEDLAIFGYDGVSYRYMLQAGFLRLVPTPTIVDTIRLWYLPHATKLALPGDVYDGVNGHEELVIEHALLRAAKRDRRPTQDHAETIAALEKSLLSALEARDQSGPDYLVDHGRGWPLWQG
jgi:hypothetical protein